MTDNESSIVGKWIGRLKREELDHGDFRKAAEAADRDYFDERTDGRKQLFNVFFSQVNTLQSRLYSKAPAPDVRRRYDMEGPEGIAAKGAAQLVERSIGFTIDSTPLHENADRVVFDFLVAGLGCPRIEYEAKFAEDEFGNPVIADQRTLLKHHPWKHFHWEPGKDWEDVDWVAFDHYLTKRQLKEQFGKEPEGDPPKREGKKQAGYRVTEVYYRPERKVYVIGWDFPEPLEVREDKLGLSGFYPCPRPMMANIKSRELVPMPDHAVFAPSYEYINRLTKRIHAITGQIKAAGFYDSQLKELAQIATAEDGEYVPVSNMAERLAVTSVTDFSKVIATLPLQEKVTVVRELQTLLAGEKARLDEQTGIADVVRGATDPNETASAQQIKNQWASVRLARKAGEVARCLRDCFRIMAEIMGEHFTPDTWYLSTGIRPSDDVLAVLKSDLIRNLAIDIETDSTVAMEDEEEKKQRIEFLNYVTPFIEKMLPAIQQGALPGDLGKELLLFAIRSFKHGRQLEDAVEAAPGSMQQLQQLQQQLQQQGQQLQQAQQVQQQMQQQIQQFDQQKVQADGMKAQADVAKSQAGAQQAQAKGAVDGFRAQTERMKAETDRAALFAGVPTHNVM